jgi:hypothetical protein
MLIEDEPEDNQVNQLVIESAKEFRDTFRHDEERKLRQSRVSARSPRP